MLKKYILCKYCGKVSQVAVRFNDKEIRCPICNDKNIKPVDMEKKNVFGYEETPVKLEEVKREPKEDTMHDFLDTWRNTYWTD